MTHALVKELSEKRQNLWSQTKTLLDSAAAEKRDLTPEESVTYDQLSGDLTTLRSRIDQVTESMATNAAAEDAITRALGTREERSTQTTSTLDADFRSFLGGETRSVEISADSMREPWKRALTKGSAAAGGNLVPVTFHDQLIQHLVDGSGLLQLGPTVLNTTSGELIEVPVTTSHGSAGAVPEGGNIATNSTDPAFAKRSLSAYKYGQLVTVSKELVDDTAFDLVGYIAEAAGRNVGLAIGGKFVTGTGTGEPLGVATSATAGKTGAAASGGAFTADDLIDLMFSVTGPYRNSPSAGWLVKDSSLGSIRKLKDGAGRYLFDPAATFGAPDTVLGKPIKTDPTVAGAAVAAKSVLFGDFSRYFVRWAGGVRFERSDEFAFGSDQITFRCLVRGDGMTVDQTGAIKAFVGGAV